MPWWVSIYLYVYCVHVIIFNIDLNPFLKAYNIMLKNIFLNIKVDLSLVKSKYLTRFKLFFFLITTVLQR